MRKIFSYTILALPLILIAYYVFIQAIPYSSGIRSGELIKISHKGLFIKTWEGEISQGISGAQIFSFSVLDEEIVAKLQEYQGKYVRVKYTERIGNIFWLGDTKYFINDIEKETSPHYKE